MIVKRSLTIRGHRTSISIEDAFWRELQSIASDRSIAIAALVAGIDGRRESGTNLSSAIRLFVLGDALARAVTGMGTDELPAQADPGSPGDRPPM